MNQLRGLGLSLVIHFVLLGTAFYFPFPFPEEKKTEKLLELTLTERPREVGEEVLPSESTGRARAPQRPGHKLSPQMRADLFSSYSFKARPESQNGDAIFDDPDLYRGSSEQAFADTDDWAYHQAIYEKIDSFLLFDSRLAKYGHIGEVFYEFDVSSRGYLIEGSLRASSQDKIL